MTDTTAYIWHLKSFNTIMRDICHQVHIVYLKLTNGLTLGIYLAEYLQFIFIEVLTHLLHHPNVTEKSSTKVTVAHDGLLNHVKMRINQLKNLVLRANFHVSDFIHLI